MKFISYAQNFEDVLLWRCFKNVKKGFYIDVGAAWPKSDSVTNAFYLRGWCGINVEPNPVLFTELVQERQRDVNLNCALGKEKSILDIYFFENQGLSTASKEIAEKHLKNGEVGEKKAVETETLEAICRQYLTLGQDIHFLKIDVEGLEREIILGGEFSVFRPQVVVVESTLPMSCVPAWGAWEDLLINKGYKFVYFDGLNRFYVSDESSYLKKYFELPVNLWDNFETAELSGARQELDAMKESYFSCVHEFEKLTHKIEDVYCSRSWKMTAPLRFISEKLKRKKRGGQP